jgi:hypothetical protein
MTNPTPEPKPDLANEVWLDGFNNPVSVWTDSPNPPSTFRDALRTTGGPSAAQGKR